ncbi:MAG: NAD(P)-binding domain-containing protein [Pseudobacteriovorax sp.]|nr:NAD(P)-binding domain-containing protein [Pseudobacteriovorax sp.]
MKVGIIGSSDVGASIGKKLISFASEVTYGLRELSDDKIEKIKKISPDVAYSTIKSTIENSDIIFIAIPGYAVEGFAKQYPELGEKTIVDCTNPIGEGVTHFHKSARSNTQIIQELYPKAKVVKSFSAYGFANFIDSSYKNYNEVKPAMLIAGNDSEAKDIVAKINEHFGFETVDAGDVSMALHLEHQALLWINMFHVQGRDFDFTWAQLRRDK